jgi:hypothetical protein
MTIPRERFRALRWARDWLGGLKEDPLVAADVKARSAAILTAYPADREIRALIECGAIGLPIDVAEPLATASAWIHAFSHATSDPGSLARVRRHLPTAEEIRSKVPTSESGHPLVVRRICMGARHWLEPDEDYVDIVVIGWLEDCAVAVAADAAVGRDAETLQDVRPRYLITSSTSGLSYEEVALMQRLRCTVPRPWTGVEKVRMCIHAAPCEDDGRTTAERPS